VYILALESAATCVYNHTISFSQKYFMYKNMLHILFAIIIWDTVI